MSHIRREPSFTAKSCISFIEKNIHGAVVVYGLCGVRQFYGYTKSEAKKLYVDECNKLYIRSE